MKLWGGRFSGGPSEVFERFSGSLHFDKKLLDADCRGSQAFARALERAGILTADERERLVAAFEQIRTEAKLAIRSSKARMTKMSTRSSFAN